MRVLLDENLPRRLRYLFPQEAEVTTVRERGWGSIENGALLALADKEFDAFLTADRNIPYQQDLSRFELTVVILEAPRNDYENLAPLMGRAVEMLRSTMSGAAIRVRAQGSSREEPDLS